MVKVVAGTSNELVEEFASYQRFRGFSQATIARRTWTLNHLAAELDGRPLLVVTSREIIRFLSERPTAQTRYHLLSDIRQLFVWARKQGYTEANPTADIDVPRLPKRAPTPMTFDQIMRVLAVARDPARLMIMLGAYAGLRVSEIAVLHTDHLEHQARIVVRNGKGGKDRIIPVAPELALALACWTAHHQGPLFKGATPDSISEHIRRTFHRAGVHARPHDLRHSFATAAAKSCNGNLVLVAALLGHADLKTTQRYVGWNPDGAAVVADLYRD